MRVLRRHVVGEGAGAGAGVGAGAGGGSAALTRSTTAATPGRYALNGGPLDADRKGASFDSARLRADWDGAELVAFKDHVWDTLERDPLFRQPIAELELSRAEFQHLTFQQVGGGEAWTASGGLSNRVG